MNLVGTSEDTRSILGEERGDWQNSAVFRQETAYFPTALAAEDFLVALEHLETRSVGSTAESRSEAWLDRTETRPLSHSDCCSSPRAGPAETGTASESRMTAAGSRRCLSPVRAGPSTICSDPQCPGSAAPTATGRNPRATAASRPQTLDWGENGQSETLKIQYARLYPRTFPADRGSLE